MATYLYGVVDAARDCFTFVNASHPSPVLVRPDGSAAVVESTLLPPLGAALNSRVEQTRVKLEPGTTLVLYTDGLVERRGSDIDAGTDRLRQLLDDNRDRAPKELVDLAVDSLAHESPDDVVAFAVHVVRPDRPSNDVAP
jgi:serine phosphatase RsbU (regulator of sigma subunit)